MVHAPRAARAAAFALVLLVVAVVDGVRTLRPGPAQRGEAVALREDVAPAVSLALPEQGNRAPDFILQDLTGRDVRLSDFRGRPVIINFWATWCPPCKEEMPRIQKFYRRFADRIVVLGIDVGESRDQVKRFVEKAGFAWTFLLDTDTKVTERYAVFAIPTTFFLDSKGVIHAKYLGPLSEAQLLGFSRAAGLHTD